MPKFLIIFYLVNFRLPSNNECESIEYIELNKQDAESLIEVYKKESTADRLKLLVDNRMKKNQEKSSQKFKFLILKNNCI